MMHFNNILTYMLITLNVIQRNFRTQMKYEYLVAPITSIHVWIKHESRIR